MTRLPRDASVPATPRRWFLYLLECRNGALYCGITTDVERRFAQHMAGRGARYTKANPPVKVVYQETCASREDALRREIQVKGLSAAGKRALCRAWRKKGETNAW